MPAHPKSLLRRALASIVVGGLLGASVVVLGAAAPASAATHTISGTVFRDFDGDGTLDTGNSGTSGIQNDVGIGGVTVTATDGRGASWTATTSAVAATLGTYSISVVDPYSTAIRVSFTGVPSAYKPSPYSAGSKTSVQFVTVAASAVTANYAVNVPEDYAQNNAPLVTAMQYSGLTTSSVKTSPTIVSTPWNANYTALFSATANPVGEEPDWDTANYPNRTTLATVSQTGSVWSTVYDPTGNAIYAAAVYKRHSGMGPLGIGGIYKVSNALASNGTVNASATVSQFLNVSTLVSVGTVASDATRGLDDPADPAMDEEAFRLAGKVGIGGLAISGGYLYFVNLADKLIYRVNLASPTAAVPYDPGFTTGERPWALTVYRGELYVGYTTTGETASGTNPGLSASSQSLTFGVKKAALTSLSTWTSVLSASQGYARAEVAPGAKNQRLRWNTWTDSWSWTVNGGGNVADQAWNYAIHLYPQALLTDIAFDTDGYMHLGLGDRTSLQGGNRNCSTTSCPNNNPNVYETFSSGDYLVAVPNGSNAFTLESNGVVGNRTTTAGESGGPGGLEFFKDRNALGTGGSHGENTLGSIATMMGSPDVVSTAYDPLVDIRVAGQNWFVLSTGAVEAGYQHNLDPGGNAGTSGTFQKGGGIGDIDLLAKAAPLQIGNRVWFDADQDGAQDADEPPVANLTVQLIQGANTDTTTTNASGEYYFSSATAGSHLAPNGGAYTVKFVKPTTGDLFTSHATFGTVPWSTVSFTTANKAGVTDDVDSDAVASGSDATIAYTAGNAGENDHTLDAGLIASRYFQVTKALDAAGGADTGASYAMTAQARDFRDDAFTLAPTDASFTLTVGGTKTIAVPVGGDAIVAETTATGAATGLFSKSVSPSTWFSVAGSSASPTPVTVTNRLYKPGRFTVTKSITDLTGLVSGTPSFGLEYAINGSTTWTSLSVNAGSTTSAISLPYGTTVKVREVSRPTVAGGTWQTPIWSGVTADGNNYASFTIGEDTTIAVTLTNPITRNNGSFTVTKAITDSTSLVSGTPSFGLEYAINGSTTWTALSVTAGSTSSSVSLPYGTTVKVREVTRPSVTGGTWSAPVWSGSGVTADGNNYASFTIGDGTNVAVGLNNPITRNNGSFTVTKTVTDSTSLVSGTPSFGLEYAINGSSSWTAFSVTAGSTTSAVSLPYGTTVKVREVSRPAVTGGTWGTPVWTGASTDSNNYASFTIGDGTTISLGLNNPITRNNGSFTVQKVVSDPDSLVSGATSFGLQYAINGSTTWTDFSVAGGSTSSAISLPYGTTVKVREISRPTVTGGTWSSPVWTGSGVTADGNNYASFTVGDGTTVGVVLTNPISRNNGSFTVQKIVSDATGLVSGTPSFGLEYAINGSSSWTALSVTAGSTTSAISLPYGTTVKVREVSRPAVTGGTWSTPAWSGSGVSTDGSGYASFTIGDGTTVGVVLTNPITRNDGSFTVQKIVSDPSSLVSGTPSFGLEYAINGSSSWTAFSVTAGSTTSAVSLPYGTTVKVREVSRPTVAGGTWSTPTWSGSGVSTDTDDYASFTIGDGTTVGVVLTNPISRNNGSFTVHKVVTDPTNLVTGTPSFGLEYAVDGSSSWTPLSVTAGSTTSAISLPYGTTVKVREVSRPSVTGGTWGTPVWTGASTDSNNYASFTIGDGTNVGLTLTNPISRNDGFFTVTKNLTGDTALVSGSPSFGLEYAINGSSTWVPFSVTAGSTTSAVTLPYGTTVKVREVSRPSVTGGSWGTPVWTGASTDGNNYASFTIGDGTTVGLTLSNPISRNNGSFTVAKVLSGDGAALASGATFGLEYATDGSSSWTPFTVTAGSTSSAITLPYGTTVKVREVSRPSITGLSWQTPVWSGVSVDVDNYASFTIGDGTTVGLTLTNPSTVTDGYFTVEKLLSGDTADTALVPGDTEFTVEYTTDDWAHVETITLTAGDTSDPVTLPYGTTVKVREAARPAVDGIGWGTADFSIGGTSQGASATFTVGDGTTVEVELTNPVTRENGTFTVAKAVTGATDLLSTPPSFELEYAIDGSSSWQSLTVTAGATTAAITLPYGTTVKLREVSWPSVTGGTWGTPGWTGSGVTTDGDGDASFTIGDTTNVAVTLTNPLDKNSGTFDVTKTLSGDATELADGTWLDIEYSTTSGLFWLPLPVQAGTTSPTVTLDYGTEVWLRENAGPSITGMTWGARTWTGATEFPDGTARFTIGDGTHVSVGLDNETERVRSGFSVTKVITGDAQDSVPDDFEFTFHYSYLDGATTVSDTVTVSKELGLTATVTGVPFGATVTLSEEEPGDAAPDVEWVAPTYQVDGLPATADGDGEISFVVGDTEVAVEVTNDTIRRYGSLEIFKVVGGSASGSVDPDQEFTIHYSSSEGEDDLTVVNGDSVELTDLPAGTVVTLSELTPVGAAPDVSWLAPVWSGTGVVDNHDGTATVTVEADTEIEVTLTNPTSQLLGRFTVEKSVIGEAAGLTTGAGPFTVEYQVDGSGPWIPLSIADGETSDPVELPTGTVVTVREDDPDAVTGVVWGVPIWGGPGVLAGPGHTASFTIGDDTTVEVALENPTTFVDTGFSVTKTVSGDARDSVDADFPFTIDYSYTTSEGLQTGTLNVTKLSNVDSLLSGVPYGTVVTLEEVAPTDAPADVQWETPEFSGDGVTDNHDGTATFTADDTLVEITLDNPTTRLYGDLEITKDVTGSAEDSVPPGFVFTVHYDSASGSGDVTVLDGGTVTIPNLPAGTVVTLSEAPRIGAPADVEWQTPEWSLLGADGAVTDNGDGTATVTVLADTTVGIQLENPTEQLLNGFSVTKSVTGEHPESVPADFEFTVHYSSDVKSGDLVLTTGGGAESVEDLPLGTVVTLSEIAPADGDPVDVDWGAPQWSGTDLTIDGDGKATFTVGADPIAILLENPTTRLYGGFSIAKEVTGAGKRILDDEYGFEGSYVYDGIEPQDFTVEAGETWTLPDADHIPAGTVVTIAEIEPTGGFPDMALTGWEEPVFRIGGTEVGDDGTVEITIEADTELELELENPTWVTPLIDIEKGDGAGGVIQHDADTMDDGEYYEPGETRRIEFVVTNPGTEDLREVVLTDETLSGAQVSAIEWTFPDDSTADATLESGVWTAQWANTFGAGESRWVPGDVIHGVATLTVEASEVSHVDRAHVEAIGADSGIEVEDSDDYNAFTGEIQVIKYDGRGADPVVQSGTDWVAPAKPLADPYQDANDLAHAAQSTANVPVEIHWVISNVGTTTLTDVLVTDTTIEGPDIDVWTCDLTPFGGPAEYDFVADGAWDGLLPPSASFFCGGFVTLQAGQWHTDRVDVTAHVIVPEVDNAGRPNGNPRIIGGVPSLALDAHGEPVVVDDDDPFLDPAAIDLAYTGLDRDRVSMLTGLALLSVLAGILAIVFARRHPRRRGAHVAR